MWSSIATWPFSLQAVGRAAEVLKQGGNALDATEQGIHTVETDPTISSIGRGGLLNEKGELELDAAIMNGDTLKMGVVASVQHFEHPITIARAVMEHTRHNILAGKGAEEFADRMGIPRAEDDYLIPQSVREQWQKDLAARTPTGHDTIGMITVDENGTVVAATSTSGASLKTPGRVGDSPIVGSGFYADSNAGGAAATGLGEDIMRTCCAFRCVQLMQMGYSPKLAVETVVKSAHEAIVRHGGKPDCIALVCMNNKGESAGAANHKGFGYAVSHSDGTLKTYEVTPVIDKDET